MIRRHLLTTAAGLAALCAVSVFLSGCDLVDPVHSPGERLFRDNCANCHGRHGGGATAYVGNTYVDLTDDIWKNGGGEYAIQTVIRNGVFGQMPAFKQLSDKEVQDLARYVVSLHAGTASP